MFFGECGRWLDDAFENLAFGKRGLSTMRVPRCSSCSLFARTHRLLPARCRPARRRRRQPAARRPATASASIVIHIPKRVAASRKGRGPRYVSPSTQSATISLAPAAGCTGCSAAVSGDLSLTPSSQNCTTNGSGTTCTHPFFLNPGTYAGAISTYDGPLGCQNSNACHALSVNQSFPWTVNKGKANELAVTLYGVPANVLIVPSTANAYAMGRIVFVGGVNQTARFTLYAADADGSLIVGPGAPSFAFSTKPANGWTASILGNVMQIQTAAAFATTKFNSFTLDNARAGVCRDRSDLFVLACAVRASAVGGHRSFGKRRLRDVYDAHDRRAAGVRRRYERREPTHRCEVRRYRQTVRSESRRRQRDDLRSAVHGRAERNDCARQFGDPVCRVVQRQRRRLRKLFRQRVVHRFRRAVLRDVDDGRNHQSVSSHRHELRV